MAIRVVRKSEATKEETSLRIKQRDYTIPVRLNQLPPPELVSCLRHPSATTRSDSSRANMELELERQQQLEEANFLGRQSIRMVGSVKATGSVAGCYHVTDTTCTRRQKAANRQPSSASTTSNHEHLSSSLISNRPSWRPSKVKGNSRPLSLANLTAIAGVIVVFTTLTTTTTTTFCNCDTIQKRPATGEVSTRINNKNNLYEHGADSIVALDPSTVALRGKERARELKRENGGRGKDNNSPSVSAKRKEQLLNYLSENIERQHFNMMSKPVKALTSGLHQRPSKFDSGGDDLSYESTEVSSNYAFPPSSQTSSSSSHKSVNNNQQSASKGTEKADDSLRQILRMHELAHMQQAHNKPAPVSEHSNLAPIGSSLFAGFSGVGAAADQSTASASSTTTTGFASRLRELSRAPVRVASNIIKPNKVVSHMLSYITPLIKLSNHQQLFDQRPNLLNSTSSLFGGFHSFGGRSNNQLSLAKKVLNNEESTQQASTKKDKLPTSNVSPSEQSPSLAKPQEESAFEKYLPTSTRNHPLSIRQPASTFLDNFGDAFLKSVLTKPNINVKDLDVSDSSSSHRTSSADSSAVKASSSSSGTDDLAQAGGPDSSSFNYDEAQRAKKFLGPAGTWIKENANKVAQNYLQDSFRGLLTLSQLPILQATPISTAPSVLEKGGRKQKKPDKTSTGTHTTTSAIGNPLSQINRNRALDELYRYAYILGTGVKRKRDPLKALGTSSNAVVNSLATTNKKFGLFSQRSRDQLIQPSNENQLINYAKGLKTILSSGGAKPRGVMWDMATDPSLAVTVFHLLERASVALPLGFLLMPFVKMIHDPLNGVSLQGLLPSRGLHRSVDYEELAKRLDVVDKMLSRALRPTHRESFIG